MSPGHPVECSGMVELTWCRCRSPLSSVCKYWPVLRLTLEEGVARKITTLGQPYSEGIHLIAYSGHAVEAWPIVGWLLDHKDRGALLALDDALMIWYRYIKNGRR